MRVHIVRNPARPDPDLIADAISVLRAGGVIAFPTDTVYGVGTLPAFSHRLFAAKGRPAAKQIPWLIADADHSPTALPEAARGLADRYWPGPLTLVVAMDEGTIGLRAPDHPLAQALLRAAGEPLAVTSANRSGEPPALDAEAAARMLGEQVDLILDGGPSPGRAASTVVRVTEGGMEFLREGAIPYSELV